MHQHVTNSKKLPPNVKAPSSYPLTTHPHIRIHTSGVWPREHEVKASEYCLRKTTTNNQLRFLFVLRPPFSLTDHHLDLSFFLKTNQNKPPPPPKKTHPYLHAHYKTSPPFSRGGIYMYSDQLSGSTMFRELIGTIPQEQSVLRVPERVLAERTPQLCHIIMKTVKFKCY